MECCCLACCAVVSVGYCKWGCTRCMIHGSMASIDWPEASTEDFKDVPRVCRLILAIYEHDIEHPAYADRISPDNVVKRVNYAETAGTEIMRFVSASHLSAFIFFVISCSEFFL